jgi:hypothetical protein
MVVFLFGAACRACLPGLDKQAWLVDQVAQRGVSRW